MKRSVMKLKFSTFTISCFSVLCKNVVNVEQGNLKEKNRNFSTLPFRLF